MLVAPHTEGHVAKLTSVTRAVERFAIPAGQTSLQEIEAFSVAAQKPDNIPKVPFKDPLPIAGRIA